MTLRVLFVTHYTTLYGANRSLLDLLDGLRAYDVQAFVIMPAAGPLNVALSERKIESEVLPMRSWVSKPEQTVFTWRHPFFWVRKQARRRWGIAQRAAANVPVVAQLLRACARWRIDVVDTISSVMPVGALATSVGGLPHIWHLREVGGLHFGFEYEWGERPSRTLIGRSNAVIPTSEAVRAHFFGETAPDNVQMIYDGVAEAATFERLRAVAESRPVRECGSLCTFAIVGHINAAKGQATAVRALAILSRQHPNVRLLVAGDGEIESLRRLAMELGIEEKVDCVGYVPDPYSVYAVADVLLMCSRYEAFGRVTVEAMAACVPVIGLAEGGTLELIADGQTGLLYQGDETQLAERMRKLLEEPARARVIGLNGWQSARERFTIETYAEATIAVLNQVCRAKARGL